jgi:hypothetical protein
LSNLKSQIFILVLMLFCFVENTEAETVDTFEEVFVSILSNLDNSDYKKFENAIAPEVASGAVIESPVNEPNFIGTMYVPAFNDAFQIMHSPASNSSFFLAPTLKLKQAILKSHGDWVYIGDTEGGTFMDTSMGLNWGQVKVLSIKKMDAQFSAVQLRFPEYKYSWDERLWLGVLEAIVKCKKAEDVRTILLANDFVDLGTYYGHPINDTSVVIIDDIILILPPNFVPDKAYELAMEYFSQNSIANALPGLDEVIYLQDGLRRAVGRATFLYDVRGEDFFKLPVSLERISGVRVKMDEFK